MARPREIILFTGLALGACLLNIISTLIVTRFAQVGINGAMLGLMITALLLFWTVRGRSLAGRLVATAWLAFAIITSIVGFAMILSTHQQSTMSAPVMIVSLISLALNCAALFFLWTRVSTDWLLAKTKRIA